MGHDWQVLEERPEILGLRELVTTVVESRENCLNFSEDIEIRFA